VEERERVRQWTEIEFTHSTLQLGGVEVARRDVARLVSMPSVNKKDYVGGDSTISSVIESLRIVESLAREEGRRASITPDLLIRIHNLPDGISGFRTSGGDRSRGLIPVRGEHLPAAVDAACRWFSAESFAELHPVEQAAIVFLRFMEIQPFEDANEQIALLAASLFTLRRELPPVIIEASLQPAFVRALEEGFQMNTKPMVELVAEAIEGTLANIIAEIG